MHYEVAGEGQPVVLIHSGITDSRSWSPQFAELAQQLRVVRYDLRGFGQSAVPRGPFSNLADLLAVMDTVGLDSAALVGTSLGGSIALDAALEYPDRVRALVLVASGYSGRIRSPEEKEIMAEWARANEAGVDAATEKTLEIWIDGRGDKAATVEPEVREAISQMFRHVYERYVEDVASDVIPTPAAGRLSEVRVPTLVMIGDRDLDHVIETSARLAAEIPGVQKAVIHGAAHAPNMERPQEFNTVLVDFLTRVFRTE